jgi:hypothetical protein
MPFVIPILRFSFSRMPLRLVVNVDTSSHLQPARLKVFFSFSLSLSQRSISFFLVSVMKNNKTAKISIYPSLTWLFFRSQCWEVYGLHTTKGKRDIERKR